MADQFQGALFSKERQSPHEPAPAVQERLRATTGWDSGGFRAMDTVSRYRAYQSYDRDRQRVDAGGAEHPALQRSYSALAEHIGPQFASVTKAVTPDIGNYDFEGGYNHAGEMTHDMNTTGSFRVNKTKPGEETAVWDNKTNDKFRAVHDLIGHGGSGTSFSPAGETVATESQRRASPKSTHRAITSEVLGQAVSFEFNGGNFLDQKGKYDVPRWAAEGRSAPNPPKRTHISRAKQGKLF